MEVAQKPGCGYFDVLGGQKVPLFGRKGAFARKKCTQLDGGWSIIIRAWEPNMESHV
jgi:hypothetical protein